MSVQKADVTSYFSARETVRSFPESNHTINHSGYQEKRALTGSGRVDR